MKSHMFKAAVALLFLLGVGIRIAALFNEFEYDEILTWTLVQQAKHPLDIFLHLRVDNNHLLNSLIMYLQGNQQNWILYRIPAYSVGLGSLVLFALLGSHISSQSKRASLLLCLIVGSVFFPLVRYSTEARGYGYLLFFGMLAAWILFTKHTSALTRYRVLFWASCALAAMSHATFIGFLPALCAWACYKKVPWMWWLPACAISVLLIGSSQIGALVIVSTTQTLFDVLLLSVLTITYPYWISVEAIPLAVTLMVVFTATVRGYVLLWKQDRSLFVFYASLLLGALPLVAMGFAREYWHPRFALLPIVFFALLFIRVLVDLWNREYLWARVASVLFALGIVGTQLLWTGELLQYGRGHMLELFQYIQQAANDEGVDTVVIAGNSGIVPIPLQYYESHLAVHPKMEFSVTRAADWYIRVTSDPLLPIGEQVVVQGIPFRHMRTYLYKRPSSGRTLQVLRNDS